MCGQGRAFVQQTCDREGAEWLNDLGFHPIAIVIMLSADLLYRFLIHMELRPRLGALELLMNTPAHHRVHHAANESCLAS